MSAQLQINARSRMRAAAPKDCADSGIAMVLRGHTPSNVAGYGQVIVRAIAATIAKLPRIEVS